MLYIPTSAVAVDKLKQLARKTKSKQKVPHSEALDRAARGAGYNHWGHVMWCFKATQERLSLEDECRQIVDAARAGRQKIVVTGPEILDRPLVLFSTADGDAWLLEPDDGFACVLCWHGEPVPAKVRDDGVDVCIEWHGVYMARNDQFHAQLDGPPVGHRVIAGYPVRELRDVMRKIKFDRDVAEIFTERNTVPLTDDVSETLVAQGMPHDDLLLARDAGAEYSPQRSSLLFPPEVG
jgi:hypothetical protein